MESALRRRASAATLLPAAAAAVLCARAEAFAAAPQQPAGAAAGQGTGAAAMERVELTNGRIVAGVLPPLGGRLVLFKAVGGENLLDADPRHWLPPFPPPSLATPFRPWNGRIVWVGPQSGFWSQQDLEPKRRQAGANWPPDPLNETGRFEVVERSATVLRLRGGTSPVTGLAFEHEFELVGERVLRLATTATNGRSTPVAWGLWPNTRVRPEGYPYVPLDASQMLRMEGPRPDDREAGAYPSSVRGSWLSFLPGARPESPRRRLWAKAYVRPARGLIAYFLGRHLLLIRAPLVPRTRLHPDQAFVEVYRGEGKNATILELEMHGPYEKLEPGARTRFEQTFELLEYDGPDTPEAHVARLDQLPLD